MDLDYWLAEPAVRTTYCREAGVAPSELWTAASTVRLRDARILGRLIRTRIPGLDASTTFAEMFRSDPFNVLDAGPEHLLSGLCGRIWTVRRDFTVLDDAQQFRHWAVPGTVRVLFAQWARETERGAALTSEVRVAPVDRRAGRYLRAMEPFIAAFQGLVGREALVVAVRRADHGRIEF